MPIRNYGNLSVKFLKKKKEKRVICLRGESCMYQEHLKSSLLTWTYYGGIVMLRLGDSRVSSILGTCFSCITTFFCGPGKE